MVRDITIINNHEPSITWNTNELNKLQPYYRPKNRVISKVIFSRTRACHNVVTTFLQLTTWVKSMSIPRSIWLQPCNYSVKRLGTGSLAWLSQTCLRYKLEFLNHGRQIMTGYINIYFCFFTQFFNAEYGSGTEDGRGHAHLHRHTTHQTHMQEYSLTF